MVPNSEPRPVWTTADIAKRLGVSAERARQLTHQPDFPPPAFTHGMARFWTIGDVEQWITKYRPDSKG
ncbi:DNA-binding protein [Parafrankia sp. FMc6]|uniref:helix-turn-helix transcriptional regulator n=1 Tax=Parafrankia soli TaxID=2599596 RepID=UPI0034D6B825